LIYDRDENGYTRGWVKMMKDAIISLASSFSTHRMLQELHFEALYACNEEDMQYFTQRQYRLSLVIHTGTVEEVSFMTTA
jgi:glucan phosphorylase